MRFAGLFGMLTLAGCVNQPQTFAPPVQRQPVLDGQTPKPAKQIVAMIDPDADASIVQDIQRGVSGTWRWAAKRPTVRIFATRAEGMKLKVDYTIADSTFKDTGPVKLIFFVNGQPLATVAETAAGQKLFEKPIPPEMLRANTDNLFAIEVDKVWVSKLDGAQLGFILTSVELTH
jgi:hypothetical protein